ncbi:MAG: hypothetical protein JNJ71_20320 [Rubrivivax sp.]|nr:hypothetical protein [Rubrivivax sp.]
MKARPHPPAASAPMPPAPGPSFWRAVLVWVLLVAGLLGLAGQALASDGAPGRVGRIAQVEGKAWFYDDDQGRWVEAWRNRALTDGDRLSTERGARLQLGIGSTEVRLAGNTELSIDRLDDDRIVLRVQSGSAAVRVRSREIARELELRVGEVRVWAERPGHYRIDRDDGVTQITSWRGSLGVDTRDQRLSVEAGRSIELLREGRDTTVVTWNAVVQDSFSDWVARDEQRDDRVASERYVSPEMTGSDDLDRYGRWDRHPDYGSVWVPVRVAVDWVPFRHGRWIWQVRWGWTWIDEAPWGFATSHYGRWLHWGGRWVWVPGSYVTRPVFSPAMVAWVGPVGSGVSVSVGLGPTVGWIPLAPRDVYVPPFRHPPGYFDRVNQPHWRPGAPRHVPTGPISYGNNGVPNAVTVVPSNVLQQRQPVAPSVIREAEDRRRHIGREPVGAPPHAPVMAVPGGAVPVQAPPAPSRVPQPAPRAELVQPMPPLAPVQPAPVQPGRVPPPLPRADVVHPMPPLAPVQAAPVQPSRIPQPLPPAMAAPAPTVPSVAPGAPMAPLAPVQPLTATPAQAPGPAWQAPPAHRNGPPEAGPSRVPPPRPVVAPVTVPGAPAATPPAVVERAHGRPAEAPREQARGREAPRDNLRDRQERQ